MRQFNTTPTHNIDAEINWSRRHLLDIDSFSRDEFNYVTNTALAMQEILTRPIKKVPALRGKTIVTLFYEPSTRTRGSFELAAKHLSADVVNLSPPASSITKGENLRDTLRTLEVMGADTIILRHHMAGAPHFAARHAKSCIINAGDGWHAHPTQTLLDIYTIQKYKKSVEGLKIVILGDSRHSRVARSNISGLTRMGAYITLCGPPTLLPFSIGRNDSVQSMLKVELDINKALDGADVVIALRIQKERQKAGLIPGIEEYISGYQLTGHRLKQAKPDAIVMHPGPVNEDIEISMEVVRCSQSVIDEQVANGIAIRMAILYLINRGNG